MLAWPRMLAALLVMIVTAGGAFAQTAEGKAGAAANVTVVSPWARATPGGSTIGAAYVEVSAAKGSNGDKLIGASSPAAGRIEIHTHEMTDGVMKMRKVESVAVAAGETRKLGPGGDHLMLFDLKSPLKEGETMPLVLKFETAGEIAVDASILSVGAMSPQAAGSAAKDASGHAGSDAGSHDGN